MRLLLLTSIVLLGSLMAIGQPSKKTKVKGYTILQDSGIVKSNDCIFCSPETMPDRIVLDSTNRMVARKISNTLGYTYYEWRNKKYTKTYEEIQLPKYKFKHATYYTDSGTINPPEKNTNNPSYIAYSMAPPNYKKPYYGVWKAEKVQIQLSQSASDSVLKLYNVYKGMITKKTSTWHEINFNENGNLKSNGLVIIDLKETEASKNETIPLQDNYRKPPNRFKIGSWQYFNEKGNPSHREQILKIRKD